MMRADLEGTDSRAGEIELRGLGVRFGSVQAIEEVELTVRPGEFVCVLGPSGCGKSTLIGVLAGFTPPGAGVALIDGHSVGRPGADRGVVFQQPTLFPWKTVLANVAFGLKMRGIARAERDRLATQMLRQVGLSEFAGAYPAQLSGGMQQRASLARVLVNRPRILLMDEPFSALDAQTRLQMQELLLSLWSEHRLTVVFVTHDIDEAIFLSDRVVVFSDRPGRIKADFKVGLRRPRTLAELTSGPFVSLKRRCLGLLRTAPDPSPVRPEDLRSSERAELTPEHIGEPNA
jgi:NitT/TauT family transport system ATP-binding protein